MSTLYLRRNARRSRIVPVDYHCAPGGSAQKLSWKRPNIFSADGSLVGHAVDVKEWMRLFRKTGPCFITIGGTRWAVSKRYQWARLYRKLKQKKHTP